MKKVSSFRHLKLKNIIKKTLKRLNFCKQLLELKSNKTYLLMDSRGPRFKRQATGATILNPNFFESLWSSKSIMSSATVAASLEPTKRRLIWNLFLKRMIDPSPVFWKNVTSTFRFSDYKVRFFDPEPRLLVKNST